MKRAKSILWAALLLAALALAARVWSRYSGGLGRFVEIAARVPPAQWLLILGAAALFYFLDYVRFASLLGLFGLELKPSAGFRLTCVSYFVSSLTPVCELHLPAMVYFLSRESVPAPVGTAVTITKSVDMTLWICLLAALTLSLQSDVRLPPALAAHLLVYCAPLAGFALVLAAVALFPEPIHAWNEARLREPGLAPWKRAAILGLDHSAAAISRIGKSRDPRHLVCHAASAAFVLVYAFIGWRLAVGVGLELTWFRALAVFSNSLMIAYLSPIPGSIGVTEWFTAYLLDPGISEESLAAAVMLRTLCWYAVLAPGAFLVLQESRREGVAPLLRWSGLGAAEGK